MERRDEDCAVVMVGVEAVVDIAFVVVDYTVELEEELQKELGVYRLGLGGRM